MNRFVLSFGIAACISAPAMAGDVLSASEKAGLQAAMVQHIDRTLVKGAYLHVDFKDGVVKQLAPAKAHPMIMSMGDNFVLCTEFRAPGGADVNMDFYVARRDKGFVVFHTEVDNRKPLEALINSGKVKPVS